MTRRELHSEIAELRATLGLRKHRTIGEWEAMPQEMRDSLAARAWISEWGDPTAALLRLGFPPLNRLPPNKVRLYSDYVARIFGTPGVQAILSRALTAIDDERAAMLARQVEIALHGQDADSVRAFQALVKVCGWASDDRNEAIESARVSTHVSTHVSTALQLSRRDGRSGQKIR